MSRVLSIASSFFAASFIVLMLLGLLSWGSTAALADEPLTANYCGTTEYCEDCEGEPCGWCNCNDVCCCNCDASCLCHDTGYTGYVCEEDCD